MSEVARPSKAKSIRMSEGVFEKEIHDKLGIDSREVCLRLERIRTADGEPVSCSIDYIPRKVFGYTELTEAMFEKSLVHTMETSFCSHSVLNDIPCSCCGG